ncbi:MAG: R2-like ligand-binding oxidase [Balneolales bacterium]|nr:R2-like ligand-binding oxidase [Balneolales bacterium]
MNEKALFSRQWMQAWQFEINNNSAYAQHGKAWEDALLLRFEDGLRLPNEETCAGFFLDLKNGRCEEIRYASETDISDTPIVLTAPSKVWEQLIKEKKDPLFMIMSGTIRLEKGSMMKLGLQRNAAKALLAGAATATHEVKKQLAAACAQLERKPDKTTATHGSPHTTRKSYATTSRGLDFDSYPMQLFQKAKQLGVWNPAAINFEQDRQQWLTFSEEEKDLIFRLTAMFMGGEEAVTLDLLPLIQVLAREGRIEEEMFLTSFLWEEAKHTEFFALFLRDVVQKPFDMEHYHGPAYCNLFHGELEPALQRLHHDSSPRAQLLASLTYNMIVEGTLAETGYEAYHRMLTEQDMLPGLREGIGLLKRDESRHIAFGLYLIERLLTANPKLRDEFETEAGRLAGMAIDVVDEIFGPYELMPFNLEKSWFADFAVNQFKKRMNKLIKA